MLWNDKRAGRGHTQSDLSVQMGAKYAHGPAPTTSDHRAVSDADHAMLDAKWTKAFSALKGAGVAHDADHPIAAAYRKASDEVNHANRSRDYGIATGKIKPKRMS